MNTFVLLGLVVLLVLFLLRGRRPRASVGSTVADRPARAGRRGRRGAGAPAPPSPAQPVAPPPATSPRPLATAPQAPPDRAPHEMIVEPGWPVPGEISGSWAAGPESSASPVVTFETPLAAPAAHEVAATASAPPRGVNLTGAESAPADDAAPEADSWQMPATAEAAIPIWRPDASTPNRMEAIAAIPPAPVAEPLDAPEPAPEPLLPAWPPVVEPEPRPGAEDAIAAQSAEVSALLPSIVDAIRPLVRVSDHVGVTPRMLVVMRALAERPLSVSEQAAALGVSRPVIADIAARLEQIGLARRERDESDRRRVRIALTERGRRLHGDAADGPAADAVAATLSRMDAGERVALLEGLRALARMSAT